MIVALQVLVLAAITVVLTGLILLATTIVAILATEVVGVADEALAATTVAAVAGIALETVCLGRDILTERRATQCAETSDSQSASSGHLEHATSVSLLSNDAGEMVKTIGIHAFLSLVHQ
jgi:hypothetical protein